MKTRFIVIISYLIFSQFSSAEEWTIECADLRGAKRPKSPRTKIHDHLDFAGSVIKIKGVEYLTVKISNTKHKMGEKNIFIKDSEFLSTHNAERFDLMQKMDTVKDLKPGKHLFESFVCEDVKYEIHLIVKNSKNLPQIQLTSNN